MYIVARTEKRAGTLLHMHVYIVHMYMYVQDGLCSWTFTSTWNVHVLQNLRGSAQTWGFLGASLHILPHSGMLMSLVS